jgi:hypothetical protein
MIRHKMGAPPGPKKESRRMGLNPRRRREKKINCQTLADSSRAVNADGELLDCRGWVSFFKVFCRRLTRYEVEHGSARWSFNLLFPSHGKIRAASREGRNMRGINSLFLFGLVRGEAEIAIYKARQKLK